jgi:hypothetical protein
MFKESRPTLNCGGMYENVIVKDPSSSSPPLPANKSTMKYAYRNYDLNLSEILALPRITGIAVVASRGNEMECIRSFGDAPPIGSRGYAGVGLTGICVSTGKVELCNDVETDSRADLQACAELGVRSVLVVPIRHNSKVAGVLEALSSKPNAFDWQTIRQIRRVARAFDPVTLESWVHSEEQQDGSAQAAVTTSAREDCGQKCGEAQPDYQDPQRTFTALQPSKELPSQQCYDSPAFGTREDPEPGLLTLEYGSRGKDRPRSFVLLGIAFIVLFVGFFAFRTHLTSLNLLPDFAPQLPRTRARLSAATSRNGLQSDPSLGSNLPVKKSAPSSRPAMPLSSAGTVAKFKTPKQNDDANASWRLALAYLKGFGVRQDERQAAKWLKKSANLGDPRAQAVLSDLYFRGAGLQRDYVRAYTWARIAADQLGGQDERLAFLRQRMTRSELEDANRRVQTWFHAQGVSR